MFILFQRILRLSILFLFGGLVLAILLWVWLLGLHNVNRSAELGLAFWMEHAWVESGARSVDTLAQKLQGLPVEDLYFHVGPLNEDGSLPQNISIPNLNVLPTQNYAWVGQLRSKIDLDSPEVRLGIVNSSQWLIDQGFDGIHVNVEPVVHGDKGFFLLLKDLRAALPEAKLSISIDEWQPHFGSLILGTLLDVNIQSYWSTAQVKEAARYVDQIVVMTYDTQFKDPRLYTWWVEFQTVALSRRLPNGVSLRVGIPSYEEGAGMDPLAENIKTGKAGFERALQNTRTKLSTIDGLAVYAYWETSDDEWNLLFQ
jgi:hypothetical protein